MLITALWMWQSNHFLSHHPTHKSLSPTQELGCCGGLCQRSDKNRTEDQINYIISPSLVQQCIHFIIEGHKVGHTGHALDEVMDGYLESSPCSPYVLAQLLEGSVP